MMQCRLRKNFKLSATAVILLILAGLPAAEPQENNSALFWQNTGAGILEPEVKHIAAHPTQPSLIYSASQNTVYLSENSGKDFKAILHIPSSDQPINKLFIPKYSPDDIYVATENGVYFSKNRGEPWQKIFQPSEEGAHQCRSIASFGARSMPGH